jgi:hypothetical protein
MQGTFASSVLILLCLAPSAFLFYASVSKELKEKEIKDTVKASNSVCLQNFIW